MKLSLTYLLLILFSINLVAQDEVKQSFLNKTIQRSISIEFPAAVSFSFADKINKNLTFGVRIQIGFGMRYMLTDPSFYYDCGQCEQPVWQKVRAITNGFFDIAKLQLFYRAAISKHFYFDVGPYGSVGIMGFDWWGGGYSLGFEASAYYTVGKLHLGFRMQAGWQFISSSRVDNNNYFAVFVTPFVIGFNF